MRFFRYPDLNQIEELSKRPTIDRGALYDSVRSIMLEVKERGDAALFDFAKAFDRAALNDLRVTEGEFASIEVSPEFKAACEVASKNIGAFHQAQKREDIEIETTPGVICRQQTVPIDRVGLYIPGGTAPLVSTLLMLAIPARIAEVPEIIVCTPPKVDGSLSSELLYVAQLLGLKNIFKVGGAQAIAAMGYGTQSVPKVAKLFGPGNQYVTAAKALALEEGIAIDLPAGPSEVAVIADEYADANWIAWDLLSQAEHGADSQVLLVTWVEGLIDKVEQALAVAKPRVPRANFTEETLKSSSAVLVRNEVEALQVINSYAPEHLIIATKNAETLCAKVLNAGSVFLGYNTPESLGDYASGTNHVLPTNGAALAWSGVSLDSFTKKISVQRASAEGLRKLAPSVCALAEAEGLFCHAEAVRVRLQEKGSRL